MPNPRLCLYKEHAHACKEHGGFGMLGPCCKSGTKEGGNQRMVDLATPASVLDEDMRPMDQTKNQIYRGAAPGGMVCKSGSLRSSSSESARSFRDLLRQLEEEHDRSVSQAGMYLLHENAKLREEISQLRSLKEKEQEHRDVVIKLEEQSPPVPSSASREHTGGTHSTRTSITAGGANPPAAAADGAGIAPANLRPEPVPEARPLHSSEASPTVETSSDCELPQRAARVSSRTTLQRSDSMRSKRGSSPTPTQQPSVGGRGTDTSSHSGAHSSRELGHGSANGHGTESRSAGLRLPPLPSAGLPSMTKTKTSAAEYEDGVGRIDLTRLLGPGTRDRYMLSPVSRIRLSWDFIAFSALLVDLWITPWLLVFIMQTKEPLWFAVLSGIITAFFVTDILMNFNTGFIDRDKLVLRRTPSIRRYMACWFWVDLLATLPFDVIISTLLSNFTGDVLSMTRLARLTKVTKVLKTLRFLKMLRAIRLIQQMGRADEFIEMYAPLKHIFRLAQILVALAFVAHVHGCAYALLQPGLAQSATVELAARNYYRCFRWAYNALTIGDMGEALEETPGLWTLEMIIASERVLVAMIIGGWGIVKALTMFQEDAQLTLVKNAAVRFFRQHQVSIETQISVMYSLHETRAAQKMQRHFKSLMSEHLPDELRRTVSEELWVPHLTTLGLISQLGSWNEDFVAELALLVREEVVASKTVLCKEGHASIAAYYILKGHLLVSTSRSHGSFLDFTEGMWVEETALVSPVRRRTSTIITPLLSRLMAVPSQQFHDLITQLGLDNKFAEFRDSVLARGLCGRCGDVGDHFTHACPNVGPPGARRGTRPKNRIKNARKQGKKPTWTDGEGSVSLNAFLHAHRLSLLAPFLQERSIETRADLEDLDFEEVERDLDGQTEQEELQRQLSLLHALVVEQQEQAALQLNDELQSAQHLAFLSHYKMESGTEAALMRAEIERVLMEDVESAAHNLNVPIFLDTEDLSDLEELQEHVCKSHNLVLLLTKDVLLRPWVLVEIVTAAETDVRVLPVEVNRKGSNFIFPDEAYYENLINGKVLDQAGEALLRERGIELRDVERALREVFNKIALPYSPHRSEGIRMAEIRAIYKQLNFRGICATSSQERLDMRATKSSKA